MNFPSPKSEFLRGSYLVLFQESPHPFFAEKAWSSSFISQTILIEYTTYKKSFFKSYHQIQQIILLVDEYLWKLSCGVI